MSGGTRKPKPKTGDGDGGIAKVRSSTLFREAVIDNAVMLPPVQFKVLMVVSQWMNWGDLAKCRPGVGLTAKTAKLSRRAVQQAITALEAKGWLVLLHRGGLRGPSDDRASIYRGSVPAEARGPAAVELFRRGLGRRIPGEYDAVSPEDTTSYPSVHPTTGHTGAASGGSARGSAAEATTRFPGVLGGGGVGSPPVGNGGEHEDDDDEDDDEDDDDEAWVDPETLVLVSAEERAELAGRLDELIDRLEWYDDASVWRVAVALEPGNDDARPPDNVMLARLFDSRLDEFQYWGFVDHGWCHEKAHPAELSRRCHDQVDGLCRVFAAWLAGERPDVPLLMRPTMKRRERYMALGDDLDAGAG